MSSGLGLGLGTFGPRYLPHLCTSDVSYLNFIAYHKGVPEPGRVEIDGDSISRSSTLRHAYDGWCRCVNTSFSSFICSQHRLEPRLAIPLMATGLLIAGVFVMPEPNQIRPVYSFPSPFHALTSCKQFVLPANLANAFFALLLLFRPMGCISLHL